MFVLGVLCGCAGQHPEGWDMNMFKEVDVTSSRAVTERLVPSAQHLSSWRELAPAIQYSLEYVAAKTPDDVAVAQGNLTVTWQDVRISLERLQALLPELDRNPSLLAKHFRWLSLADGAQFSGYYEAEFNASRTRGHGYTYPLYKRPPDLHVAQLGEFDPDWLGMRLVYRVNDKGELLPYFSRAEIDGCALAGRGLELLWVKDAVDAYFLQLQGSGRVRLTDGSVTGVLYDGDNGRPYHSLGRIMSDEGEIDPGDVSMQSIRAWLTAHPDSRDAVLHRNERYVFFRLGTPGAIGALGRPVTPWVSVAVDRTTFPLGGVVVYRAPLPSGMLTGIGLAQDTGGAIKNRRMDLFCGSGQQAGEIAGRINSMGEAWLLLAR